MQQLNEKLHYSTLINSLSKEYNKNRIGKSMTPDDIYILDIIYNLLQDCCIDLNNDEKLQLLEMYSHLLFNSDVICNNTYIKVYQTSKGTPFVQAEKDDCNDTPVSPTYVKIYYWQEESPTTTIPQVIAKSDSEYVLGKNNEFASVFDSGKDITYVNVGRICFSIITSKLSDNYKIYDYLNNDVTAGFNKSYLTETKSILFVSNNIYANGTINFKIKLT